jgi:hypothetical protein
LAFLYLGASVDESSGQVESLGSGVRK